MIELTTKGRDRYLLDDGGAVVSRSDGPKGWDYSGKWVIVGFLKRWNSTTMVTLDEALCGDDIGHGYVVDRDHGTLRMWASPSHRRVASLRYVEDNPS